MSTYFLRLSHISSDWSLQGLNWSDLAEKKVQSPFRPELRNELDVGNFAEEFTGMEPVYSPASTPPSTDRLFQVLAHANTPVPVPLSWRQTHAYSTLHPISCHSPPLLISTDSVTSHIHTQMQYSFVT